MSVRGNLLKQKGEPIFAYTQSKSHSNNSENANHKENSMDTISLECTYEKKTIKLHLEFPKQSDKNAEQEFIERLKEIYLKKLDLESVQSKNPEVQSQTTKEKGEKNHEH